MTRRIHRQQLTFEAGEVSESYGARHDSEKRLAGAQEIVNMVVDEGGGLQPRGSIIRKMAWTDELFSVKDPSFIMFPFKTRDYPGLTTRNESLPKDFLIVLSNVDDITDASLTTTIKVHKFDPETGGFSLIGTIESDDPAPDPIPRIGSSDISINAVQADQSLWIVSSHFPPHRFIESKNPSPASGSIQQVQFYKDIKGLVDLTTGDDTVRATSGIDTEFNFEFNEVDDDDLNVIRLTGEEYTIANIVGNNGEITLDALDGWVPPAGTDPIFSALGNNASGVQAQRRWPVNGEDAQDGTKITDGVWRPRVVAFAQGRLILGSNLHDALLNPGQDSIRGGTNLWISRVGDPFTIVPAYTYSDPLDGSELIPPDAPIQIDLLLDAGDAFEWALGTTQVYFGSPQSIYALTNTQNGIDAGALVGAQKISGVGAKDVQITERDGNPVYIASDSGGVMGARFDLLSQGFQRDDLTRHTKDLASNLIDIAYSPPTDTDRAERVLCVKEDGTIVVGGIFPDREIVAWSKIKPSDESLVTLHGVKAMSSGIWAVIQKAAPDADAAIVEISREPYSIEGTEYAIDLPSALANKPDWDTAEKEFFGSTVAAIVKIDGEWLHLGPVNIDGSGNLLYIPNGNLGFEAPDGQIVDYGIEPSDALLSDIVIGFPYRQSVTLFPQTSSDGRGFSIGRRTRVLSVSCDIVRTRQFQVDGRTAYSNLVVAGSDPRERTEWKRQRLMGRSNAERPIKIESVEPYPLRLRAVVQEVSV